MLHCKKGNIPICGARHLPCIPLSQYQWFSISALDIWTATGSSVKPNPGRIGDSLLAEAQAYLGGIEPDRPDIDPADRVGDLGLQLCLTSAPVDRPSLDITPGRQRMGGLPLSGHFCFGRGRFSGMLQDLTDQIVRLARFGDMGKHTCLQALLFILDQGMRGQADNW